MYTRQSEFDVVKIFIKNARENKKQAKKFIREGKFLDAELYLNFAKKNYSQLAEYYLELNNFQQSLVYFGKALRMCQEVYAINKEEGFETDELLAEQAKYLGKLADVLHITNSNVRARVYYRDALDIYEELDEKMKAPLKATLNITDEIKRIKSALEEMGEPTLSPDVEDQHVTSPEYKCLESKLKDPTVEKNSSQSILQTLKEVNKENTAVAENKSNVSQPEFPTDNYFDSEPSSFQVSKPISSRGYKNRPLDNSPFFPKNNQPEYTGLHKKSLLSRTTVTNPFNVELVRLQSQSRRSAFSRNNNS